MPRSTLAVVMLILAVSTVQRPQWWLERLSDLQEQLRRFPLTGEREIAPASRAPYDRGTVRALRVVGALFAVVAAMSLYQEATRLLDGFGR